MRHIGVHVQSAAPSAADDCTAARRSAGSPHSVGIAALAAPIAARVCCTPPPTLRPLPLVAVTTSQRSRGTGGVAGAEVCETAAGGATGRSAARRGTMPVAMVASAMAANWIYVLCSFIISSTYAASAHPGAVWGRRVGASGVSAIGQLAFLAARVALSSASRPNADWGRIPRHHVAAIATRPERNLAHCAGSRSSAFGAHRSERRRGPTTAASS